MLRTKEQWEKIYTEHRTPWDAESPDPHFVSIIKEGVIQPCAALDLGCGTGNEAIFLAQRGFEVIGVDISQNATKEAGLRASKAGVKCDFIVSDILTAPIDRTFDLVLDRACFHFLDPKDRGVYLKNLCRWLRSGGTFFLVVSSSHETAKGPHQFSKTDLQKTFDHDFYTENIKLVTLQTHGEKPRPYICLFKKK